MSNYESLNKSSKILYTLIQDINKYKNNPYMNRINIFFGIYKENFGIQRMHSTPRFYNAQYFKSYIINKRLKNE